MCKSAFVRCLCTLLLYLAVQPAPAAAQVDFMVTFNANAEAGDAARQRLAEAMIHEAAFALAAHDNAMSGRAPFTPQQPADHADRNLRQKGTDFRAMRLTDSGFVLH